MVLRCGGAYLAEIIVDPLGHLGGAPQTQVARSGVELGADVVLGAVTGTGGTLDGVLHRLDDDRLVDQFLARDGIGDGEKLGLVGGDGARGAGGCARTCGGGHEFQSCPSTLMESAPSAESGAVASISLDRKSAV